MGSFGDFYNKNKRKPSKEEMARKANKTSPSWVIPAPVVIKKGKKEENNW